jgi:hypothetical protein
MTRLIRSATDVVQLAPGVGGEVNVPEPAIDESIATMLYVNNTVPPIGRTNIHFYTTAGAHTWTKPAEFADDSYVVITVVGAGGGAGATQATGATEYCVASSGGCGGVVKQAIIGAFIGDSISIVVGAGGAGATTSGASGANGGTSTATTLAGTLTSGGGFGGSGGVASSTITRAPVSNGGNSFGIGISSLWIFSAVRADSKVGWSCQSPAIGVYSSVVGATIFSPQHQSGGTGKNGIGPGGGGAAPSQGGNSAFRVGGNGADGLVIIEEYI